MPAGLPLLPLLFLLPPLRAETLLVGPDEDYASISDAMAAAVDGDVIQVLPGTYEDSFKVNVDVVVEPSSEPGSVTVDVSGTENYGGVTIATGTLSGLRIVDAPEVGIHVTGPATVQQCEVESPGTHGVYVTDAATVDEVVVSDAGSLGFKVAAEGATVLRSLSVDAASYGFVLTSEGTYANLLALGGASGFKITESTSLSHAMALACAETGFEMTADTTLTNVVSAYNPLGLDCQGYDTSLVTSLLWEEDTTDACPTNTLANAIRQDPAFRVWDEYVGLHQLDLRPQEASPMVDAGTGTDPDETTADLGLFGGEHGEWTDQDEDGHPRIFDCDDTDETIHVGAEEDDDNGVDDDCDAEIDETGEGDTGDLPDTEDLDGDGYSDATGDCDDHNVATWPGASEIYDTADNDCDGEVDEGTFFVDDDGDGWSEEEGDCDDTDADRHPQATDDDGDGVDDDCDGADDAGGASDADGDGYTVDEGDCDDTDAEVNPGAWDGFDQVDTDCDGLTDGDVFDRDQDGDGLTQVEGDCNDEDISIGPHLPELADDFIDQDCDGTDLYDIDGDGDPAPVSGGTDCDDEDPTIHPGAEERCDGHDNDCDGNIDEKCNSADDGAFEAEPAKRVVTAACNCASGHPRGAAGAVIPLILAVFARRRRR